LKPEFFPGLILSHYVVSSHISLQFKYTSYIPFSDFLSYMVQPQSLSRSQGLSDLDEWSENKSFTSLNREVKHDVYGKRQKRNFCRLSSAVCTVEWNYLYLQLEVGDVITFSWALFTD